MDNDLIRMADGSDAQGILDIYSHYVNETPITFEYETPSVDDMRKRIGEITSEYPYLVCVSDGRIIGFAYAHKQKERAAYQWNAECSVYLAPDAYGNGIGKALYAALLEILRLQKVQNVYAGIANPNPRSEQLHKSLGFKTAGVFHSTGFKCGGWHDVSWFEKQIGDRGLNPAPFIKIGEISKDVLDRVFRRYRHF